MIFTHKFWNFTIESPQKFQNCSLQTWRANYKVSPELVYLPLMMSCLQPSISGSSAAGDGEIRFLGSLDHDTRPSYTILVTARDSDGLTANATVNVLVTDVNDNPPVFTQEQYNFEILENEPQGEWH